MNRNQDNRVLSPEQKPEPQLESRFQLRRKRKERKTILSIGTLNAQTLKEEGRWTELEMALSKKTWDVIGLSEIRRGYETAEERKTGNLVFHSSSTNGLFGTGFIVHKRWKDAVKEFRPVNTRIAALKMEIKGIRIWIIQAHFPTSQREEEQVEEVYEEIENNLTQMRKETKHVILIGDFNASIGSREKEEENIIGKYTFGKRNERGKLLVNFMMKNNLTEISSWFQAREEDRWTWESPTGNKYKIDYLLMNGMQKCFNCKIGDFEFNSDHRLTLSKINFKFERRFRIQQRENKPKPITLGSTTAFVESLKLMIKDKETTSMNLEDKYKCFEECILAAAKASKDGGKRPGKRMKISEETRKLILKREYMNRIAEKTIKEKIEHSELRKLVRREIRKDIRKYEDEILKEIISNTGATKKALKEVSHTKRKWAQKLEVNGKKITDRDEIVEAFTRFFENIYKCEGNKNEVTKLKLQNRNENENEPKVTKQEVLKVLGDIKPGKAPGPDQIMNDMLRIGSEQIAPILSEIFTDIINSGKIPQQWQRSKIILLFKKGCREIISNYRPITLSSCVYRVFARIIRDKIEPTINGKQPEEQAGFRPSYSTMDHLQTINQLIEKSKEYGRKLYLAFIDFNKAFDTIKQEALWDALEECGVKTCYINVIRKLYENNEAYISMDKDGRNFEINRGVKQGCPLSPILFNCVLEAAFKELDWTKDSIYVKNKPLNNLRFADDVILMAESAKKLTKMMSQLVAVCVKRGLTINRNKTNILTNSEKFPIYLENEKLEYVDEAIYLGQTISFENRVEKEVERRIKLGWKKFWSLRKILKGDSLSVEAKGKIINSSVIPVITYGCQTWALNKKQYERLRATHMSMLRSILKVRISDKIKNEEILRKTKVQETLNMMVMKIKMRWAGHVARLPKERWAWRSTFWIPVAEKKRRGRKAKRWCDIVVKIAGNNWAKKAEDRLTWNGICENLHPQTLC